jgi:hypothetical protein
VAVVSIIAGEVIDVGACTFSAKDHVPESELVSVTVPLMSYVPFAKVPVVEITPEGLTTSEALRGNVCT